MTDRKKKKKPLRYFLKRKDILRFYADLRRGKYAGRPIERWAVEEMFYAAVRAGVIK